MRHEDIRRRGFKERTRLADARDRLHEHVSAHSRVERVDLREADGRVLATDIAAARDVPHYERAAMDGFAVRATDTVGASRHAPGQLRIGDAVTDGTASRVHTGSEMPAGADAVIMIEDAERRDELIDVFAPAAVGQHVAEAGEDVRAGDVVCRAGQWLRPSDLGLLKAVGRTSVQVVEQPIVAVVPTGDELVETDPAPGEIIETNGLTVASLVRRWGGQPRYRSIVTDDDAALDAALTRDRDADIIVTTGGSSVGERDRIPEVVDARGEVFVHGVALKPGHPVALGVVEDTPVLMLPGYPVACIVNAVQLLRPAIAWAMGTDPPAHPTVQARLERKLRSEAGHRTFARVAIEQQDGTTTAVPVRTSGAGVLSSVTEADGWVAVPEAREGIPAGEDITVELWEWAS